ncbi:conserved hypothetical protein (plasmid) [Rippkaea orientalis PCC 8801]|uniref:DUF4926 domain-containing protein n=1 Tax=Rippkaea orientalis (strain PCC 8801 / RF-1) TaxID=41431 RepID=B7K6N1_RIPO1|nr:DUF4926 domain-containing protein [Rippkaea orientalis]ACK68453.1 conserved hypothetical protein [Rippkaea orientalis PCC 8801]
MNKPELFDVIELLTDIPEFSLRKGEQGAIIDNYEDGVCSIEFTNKKGETTANCSIPQDKFTVVWSSKTEQWLTPIVPR